MTPEVDETRRTFAIRRCLGRGGFGEVYLGTMTHPSGLESQVALKVLRRDVPPDSQAVHRLRDEARLLARAQHPSILRVHDLVILGGRVCLVTEFVDGEDLSGCLRGEQPLPLRGLLQVVADVAGALHAAYNAEVPGVDGPLRIVHRDVKPTNIRLGKSGGVKLLDFGIARTDEMTREAVTAQRHAGSASPRYMAPERFTRASPHPGSDVFSLGIIVWEGIARRKYYDMPLTFVMGLSIDAVRYAAFLQDRMRDIIDLAPPSGA